MHINQMCVLLFFPLFITITSKAVPQSSDLDTISITTNITGYQILQPVITTNIHVKDINKGDPDNVIVNININGRHVLNSLTKTNIYGEVITREDEHRFNPCRGNAGKSIHSPYDSCNNCYCTKDEEVGSCTKAGCPEHFNPSNDGIHFEVGLEHGFSDEKSRAVAGSWSKWRPCSLTCGGGYRKRDCNNPRPQRGGEWCRGDEVGSCNTEKCNELEFNPCRGNAGKSIHSPWDTCNICYCTKDEKRGACTTRGRPVHLNPSNDGINFEVGLEHGFSDEKSREPTEMTVFVRGKIILPAMEAFKFPQNSYLFVHLTKHLTGDWEYFSYGNTTIDISNKWSTEEMPYSIEAEVPKHMMFFLVHATINVGWKGIYIDPNSRYVIRKGDFITYTNQNIQLKEGVTRYRKDLTVGQFCRNKPFRFD